MKAPDDRDHHVFVLETRLAELQHRSRNALGLVAASPFTDLHLEVDLSVVDITLDSRIATPLGLITTECVMNSLKYGFKNRTTGVIRVTMEKITDYVELVVADNGVGMSDCRDDPGIGVHLLQSLAEQLNGTLVLESECGTACTVRFPV